MRKERELIMETRKSANIGARLDRLPNSGWHIKMWLVTAFALLVCWSNGIGGSVQNILLNDRPDLCCCRNNRSMYFDLRRRD